MSAIFFDRTVQAQRERAVQLWPKLWREMLVWGKVGFRSPPLTTTNAQSFPIPPQLLKPKQQPKRPGKHNKANTQLIPFFFNQPIIFLHHQHLAGLIEDI